MSGLFVSLAIFLKNWFPMVFHFAPFLFQMDELSRETLFVQNIDPDNASEDLPRRRNSDLPDLQLLHAKLFKPSTPQQDTGKETATFASLSKSAAPGPLDRMFPVLTSRPLSSKSPDHSRVSSSSSATKDVQEKELLDASREISKPPQYPPPPAPPQRIEK